MNWPSAIPKRLNFPGEWIKKHLSSSANVHDADENSTGEKSIVDTLKNYERMNKSDLELYTPEKWYVNIYNKSGHLLLSWGFTSKKIAEHTQTCIIEEIESMLQSGAKKNPNVEVPIVEESIGWKVGEETFSNYHDALWYSWNNHNAKIKGIFKNSN